MEPKKYDTIEIFVYLWKNRKTIITITLAGAIISIITSLMIKNKYKATALAYPAPIYSVPLSSYRYSADPTTLGGEGEAERMIQILQSDEIFYKMLEKFNLMEYYKIKKSSKYAIEKTKIKFRKNLKIKKTKYYAVEISVIDKNPIIATKMVNELLSLFDTLLHHIQNERSIEFYQALQSAYDKQESYIKKLEDSLLKYRQKGILLYGSDVDRLNEAYWKSLGRGTLTAEAERKFLRMKDTIIKYSETIRHLEKEIEISMSILLDLRTKLFFAKNNLETNYTRKYTLSEAKVPQKKYSPKRTLIVLFSTIGAFVFSIVILLFNDFYKELKNRIKIN